MGRMARRIFTLVKKYFAGRPLTITPHSEAPATPSVRITQLDLSMQTPYSRGQSKLEHRGLVWFLMFSCRLD